MVNSNITGAAVKLFAVCYQWSPGEMRRDSGDADRSYEKLFFNITPRSGAKIIDPILIPTNNLVTAPLVYT